MKEIVEVEIQNIKVGKRHYSFDYKIWRNGKSVDVGSYDSTHSRSTSFVRKRLNNGWATDLVLEYKF